MINEAAAEAAEAKLRAELVAAEVEKAARVRASTP